MRSHNAYKGHLDGCSDLSQDERDIIIGFVEYRDTVQPTTTNTRLRQGYGSVWVCRRLHDVNTTLDKATIKNFLAVAQAANFGTKNTRQTYITTLKGLSHYIHRFVHPIVNIELLDDVKAGSAQRNRKEALTLDEWNTVLNLPMSARDRAILAVMYDGYHRPAEVLQLKWSDLKITNSGIEYDVLFKTDIHRTIVQKPGTTAILEAWRRESGQPVGCTLPIFPAHGNGHYETIIVLKKLFNRLKKDTGIKTLKPSIIRTSALTHDVEAGMPISYICLRAWGVPFNEIINLYTKPDSGKIQREQHVKDGITEGKIIGTSGKFSITSDPMKEEMERLMKTFNPDDFIRYWTWVKEHPEG